MIGGWCVKMPVDLQHVWLCPQLLTTWIRDYENVEGKNLPKKQDDMLNIPAVIYKVHSSLTELYPLLLFWEHKTLLDQQVAYR